MLRENGWDELNKYRIKTQKKNREPLIFFKSEYTEAHIDYYEL